MPDTRSQNQPIAVRRTAYFSGNVQGIGFRYTTCQIARDYPVTGYVKNLLDGRVEIVAEGLPEEVDRFISAVTNTMSSYIEYATTTDSTARGAFQSFAVEY